MKQMSLFDQFNASPPDFLGWLGVEQESGRMYSLRELLRLPMDARRSLAAPPFSRSGLARTLNALESSGAIVRDRSAHRKIVVTGTPLPLGSSSFLRADVQAS